MSTSHDAALLVVVIDVAPATLVTTLSPLKVFLEAHVIMRPGNRVVLLATFGGKSAYVNVPVDSSAGPGRAGALFGEGGVTQACAALVEAALAAGPCAGRCSMAAAASMAVCFIHRWSMPPEPVATRTENYARIFILTEAATPLGDQYRPLMNCVFSAQKMGVLIDCLNFSRTQADIPPMQQACFLTGGTYVHAYENVDSAAQDSLVPHVLPLLVYHFLSPQPCRRVLSSPSQQTVAFNATCFETGESINIGYLCSVCLSVTRRKTKECLTCNSAFPLERNRAAVIRRKPPSKS